MGTKNARLSPEDIAAFTATVVDLLKEGQDMKQIAKKFTPGMHGAVWVSIQDMALATVGTEGK
jgi:hypothetical protein